MPDLTIGRHGVPYSDPGMIASEGNAHSMRLRLAELVGVLALAAAFAFFFAAYVWRDMPPEVSFAGVWTSGSVFCVVAAWHFLRDSAHQFILRNAPWFVIFGMLAITVAGVGVYRQQVPPKFTPPANLSVLLLWENDELRLYNRGDKDIYLWGDKYGTIFPLSIEAIPRTIPRDGFYYFLTENIRGLWELALAPDGQQLIPFEVYLKDDRQNKFTAKFALLVVFTHSVMKVHTQQLGVSDVEW